MASLTNTKKRPRVRGDLLGDEHLADKLTSTRFAWSKDFHELFMIAIFDMGLQVATEKNISEIQTLKINMKENIHFSPMYIRATIQKLRTFRYFDVLHMMGNGGVKIPHMMKPPECVSPLEGNAQLHGQCRLFDAAFECNNNPLTPLNVGGSKGDDDSYSEDLNYLEFQDDQEIPLKVNCDTLDLKLIAQNTSDLITSLENKRTTMNSFLLSICDTAKSMHEALEVLGSSTSVQNVDKNLSKTKKCKPGALAASSMQLIPSPKEDIQEDITKDHAAAGGGQYYVEQTPPSNMGAAVPTMDVTKLKQEMMNHMFMHRQMWSKQQDQLQVDRLAPAQAYTESVANTNTDPLSPSFVPPNWTDFPVLMPPAQSNGMPTLNSAANSYQSQKKGDNDGILDWNVDVDVLNEDDLFDFLG